MHHIIPNTCTPKPSDPPFLFAVLIGAMRSGDTMMESLASDWLADLGVHIHVDANAPILNFIHPIVITSEGSNAR